MSRYDARFRQQQQQQRGPPMQGHDFRPPFHTHQQQPIEFQGPPPQPGYDPYHAGPPRMPDSQWNQRMPPHPQQLPPHQGNQIPGQWQAGNPNTNPVAYDPVQPAASTSRGGDRDRFQRQPQTDSARERGSYQRRNNNTGMPPHAPISIPLAQAIMTGPMRQAQPGDRQDRQQGNDLGRSTNAFKTQEHHKKKDQTSSDRKSRDRQDDQAPSSSSNKRPRLENEDNSQGNAGNRRAALPVKPSAVEISAKSSYTRKSKEDDTEQRGRSRRSPSVDSVGRVRRARSASSRSSSEDGGSHYRRKRAPRSRSPPPSRPPPASKSSNKSGGGTGPNEAAVREFKIAQAAAKPQRHVRRGRSPRSRSRSPPRRASPARPKRQESRRGKSRSISKSRSRSRSRERKPKRYNNSQQRGSPRYSSPPRRRSPSPNTRPTTNGSNSTSANIPQHVSRPPSPAPVPPLRQSAQPLPPQSSIFANEASNGSTPKGPKGIREWGKQEILPKGPKTGSQFSSLPLRPAAPVPIVPSSTLGPGFKRVAPATADVARAQVRKFFPGEEDIDQVIAAAERAAMERESHSRSLPPPPSGPLAQQSLPSGPSTPISAGFNISQAIPEHLRMPFAQPNMYMARSQQGETPAINSPFPPGDSSMKHQYGTDTGVVKETSSMSVDLADVSMDGPTFESLQSGQVTPAKPALLPPAKKVNRDLYERLNQVGEGTYGKVYKARNTETGIMVALKRIRMEAEKDGFPITSVREIKLLQSMKHDNVIGLIEMMVSQGSVYMVFEYMDHDLTGVLRHPDICFTPAHLKSLMHQLLEGLSYIHKRRILHRDLKGSNILLSKRGELKIADFGLARFYVADRKNDYTNRVITQWYKPPELLYGGTVYEAEVDMWSAGCIFLELFTKRPVFQGQDEIHQLEVIFKYLGTPSAENWPSVSELPWYELVKPKEVIISRFRDTFGIKYLKMEGGMDLAEALLALDPSRRPTAADALQLPYFTSELPKAEQPVKMLSEVRGDWHELEVKQKKFKDSSKKSAAVNVQ